MDVSRAFAPAFSHTMRVLFRPFGLKKWLALGIVSLLGGGTGGGSNIGVPYSGEEESVPPGTDAAIAWVQAHLAMILAGVAALVVLGLLLLWISCVFQFVYVNQVARDPRAIREPFARLKGLATSYFLWQIGFGAIVAAAIGVLIALPVVWTFVWSGGVGTPAKVICVAWAAMAGIGVFIIGSVACLLAGDFVIPAMYVRNTKVIEGWKRVLRIVRANAGQTVLYLLLRIVIEIGVGVVGIVALIAVVLAFVIPVGAMVLVGFGIWKVSAQSWTPVLIGYTAAMSVVAGAAFSYALLCAIQPGLVFRRTYSLVVLGQADASVMTVPPATR